MTVKMEVLCCMYIFAMKKKVGKTVTGESHPDYYKERELWTEGRASLGSGNSLGCFLVGLCLAKLAATSAAMDQQRPSS